MAMSKKEYDARYSRKLKQAVIDMYGPNCACCGESNIAFLTVEHTDNSGADHRRRLNPNASTRASSSLILYRDILKERNPVIAILCYNCNCASYKHEGCPHKKSGLDIFSGTVL